MDTDIKTNLKFDIIQYYVKARVSCAKSFKVEVLPLLVTEIPDCWFLRPLLQCTSTACLSHEPTVTGTSGFGDSYRITTHGVENQQYNGPRATLEG